MRHLKWSEDGFTVEWSLGFTDSRLLNATARLNLEACAYYVIEWLAEEEQKPVLERIDALIDDLEVVGSRGGVSGPAGEGPTRC